MSLPRINTLLLVLIIVLNGYVIAAPLLPVLLFDWQSKQGQEKQLSSIVQNSNQSDKIPTVNSVIIPSMLLNQPILEGPTRSMYKILDQGVWRWPNSSTPNKGGNTVLIGHRFTYTNPRGVFYFLNKVSIGDSIGIIWDSSIYRYRVTHIEQVAPNETSIENNTRDARVTIFTCTPLWLPKNRLVVIASYESKETK